jgi:hypothetical protein
VVTALGQHISKPLDPLNGDGTYATTPHVHPCPNASDVQAAPISHVGSALTGQHVPQYTSDHTGFSVVRNPAVLPAVGDFAYLLEDISGNSLAGIKQNGDLLNSNTNYPLLSSALTALFGHVSQTVACNPHGTTLAELGGVDLPTMQAGDANAIAVSEAAAAADAAAAQAAAIAAVPAIVTSMFSCTLTADGQLSIPTNAGKDLILQWGQCANETGGTTTAQPFNPHFPNACFGVFLSNVHDSGTTAVAAVVSGSVTQDGFSWTLGAGGEVGGSGQPYWFALGC